MGVLTLILSTSSFGANSKDAQIRMLMQRTKMLEQQLQSMQHELTSLEHAQYAHPPRVISAKYPDIREHAAALKHQEKSTITKGAAHHRHLKRNTPSWVYTQGTPITSSPYLGTHSEFDASDLIVNISSINEDVRILRERQRLNDRLKYYGLAQPQHPLLVISGKAEGQVLWSRPFNGTSTSDVDLATGEIELAAEMDPWVTGFIGLDYDNTPPLVNVSRRRIDNSRIFLNKGFVTIGNFNRSPIYFSIGQMYLPFGRYSSNMISAPFTLIMARTNSRALLIGYRTMEGAGLYASAYTFAGDARTSNAQKLNQFGGDLGYDYQSGSSDYNFGVSYIRSLADADGMQNTGGAIFGGFAAPNANPALNNELLARYVPGIDFHGVISVGRWVLLGEYVSALRAFNVNNMMFNNSGAKPLAMNFEAAYNIPIFGKPTSFAVGYGQTNDALALNLPRRRFIGVINMSIWRDTIASIEYRHDVNYGINTVASGTNSGIINAATNNQLGRSSDAVTAQFGIYF